MRTRVINLARRPDRWAQFLAWNKHQTLDFDRFEAIDASAVDLAWLSDQVGLAGEGTVRPAALACALSHKLLLQEAVDQTGPTLILEDDACLRGDVGNKLAGVLEGLPQGWDMLALGFNSDAAVAITSPDGTRSIILTDQTSQMEAGFFERFSSLDAPVPTLLPLFQAWGNLAYVISPAGARKLLDLCFPIDTSLQVILFAKQRTFQVSSYDSAKNYMLQRHPVSAHLTFPVLAAGPNDHASSDIQPMNA